MTNFFNVNIISVDMDIGLPNLIYPLLDIGQKHNINHIGCSLSSGRGNGVKIVTTPYHASSLDLAPQGRARYGVRRCYIKYLIFSIGTLLRQVIKVCVICEF